MRRLAGIVSLLAGMVLLATSWEPFPTEKQVANPSTLPGPTAENVAIIHGDGITQVERNLVLSADLVESHGIIIIKETASPLPLITGTPTPDPVTATPTVVANTATPTASAKTATPTVLTLHSPTPANPAQPATFTAVAKEIPTAPTATPSLPTPTPSPPQPTGVAHTITPTATALPTPTPTEKAEPIESDVGEVELPKLLRLPAVGIEAAFEYVGLTPEGAMDVPKHPDRVAWYQLGPRPGQSGNAVIAGHVDWAGRVRAFWWLNRLGPGDLVEIIDQNDKSYSFVIQWKRMFNASAAPVQEIFASSTVPEITLITCGGVFDPQTKQYLSRLVVRAALQ